MPAAKSSLRRPLLSSCAIAAALAVGGHSAQLRAQAFQGNPTTIVSGSIVRTTGVNSETIAVNTPSAVVNWTPTDTAIGGGDIDYLPAGNVATFTNGASNGNFVILNRILPADPTRAVAFNGTVLSQILVPGKPAVTGGSVWFYSPGGIIVGSKALFDVGSLVLTANNLDDLDVNGNILHFRGAADSRSAVTINSGARLNATQSGSYVALVAPRVTQGGTVNVNGSAAYVAAESADLTINGGLFDITVQTGSVVNPGGETTLNHTGTTTGDGPLDATDPQLIYIVAVPKNDAITMLVTGSAGYLAAGSAGIENGAVVLSAGQGVSSLPNTITNADVALNGSLPGQNATIQISGGDFKSPVVGFATTDALADGGTGTLNFASALGLKALDLNAGRNARLTADAGQTIHVAGSMAVRTYNRDNSGGAAAGQASIRALGGGVITVDGGATAEASSIFSGAVAGSALFEANGSSVSFGGEVFIRANGDGVGGGTASATLVNSDVGIATAALGSNGFTISATGTGISGPTGGAGIGGSATILVDNSSLTIGSASTPLELILDASARGGDGNPGFDGPDGGAGGSATGGTATFTMNSGTFGGSSITLLSDAYSGNGGDAIETGSGVSGNGGNGGTAAGGTARFVLNGGTVSAAGLDIGAAGFGGGAGSSDLAQGGLGGNGTGGTARLLLSGSGLIDVTNVDLDVTGMGGASFETGYGAGGSGIGGTAEIQANAGTIAIDTLVAQAGGIGANGGDNVTDPAPAGNGGSGTGGDISVATAGGTLNLLVAGLSAQGEGGSGGAHDSGSGGNGGGATGGSITFMAKDSAFDFSTGFAQMDVSATGGDGGSSGSGMTGGIGGNGTAGTITLAASGIGGALGFNSNFIVSNDAIAGDGGSGGSGTTGGAGGNGGGALGGTFEITTDLGSVTIVGTGNTGPTVTANAFGGDGGSGGDGSDVGNTGGVGGNGGNGTGGLARINVNGGSVLLGVTNLTAEGSGGFAGSGGTGPTTPALPGIDGGGFGGTVSIIVNDSALGGEVGSAGLADTSINVGGFFDDGFDDVGGRIEIYDFGTAPGGGLSFASLTALSVGIPNSMNEIFDLFSAERRIDIAGDADIQLGSPASFRATANGGVDIGGTLNLSSGSFVQIEHDLQPATPADTISASDIVAVSESTFNADPDSRIQASGTIDISSNSGAITLNHVGAGGDIFANAPNGMTIGTVDAGGNVDLSSSGGAILVSTDLAAAGLASATGTSVTLNALGDLDIQSADAGAGDIIVNSGGDLSVDSATASGNVSFDATGTLALASLVSGLSIDLASADIAIASDALIGDANTASLSFFNNGNARTFIGGGGSSGGYSLSNAEFSTVEAAQIGIFGSSASSTAGPELVVQSLDIAGSASSSSRPNLMGPNASLFIQSPNRMQIEGDMALTSAGSNDRLDFSANRIDLITPAGSIVATDPGGTLAGTISMSANRIFVGSDTAAAAIALLGTTDEIDNRLGTNDGPVKPEGYLQAGALDFTVFQSLLVQNSGSELDSTARAGFTAGDGGVTINAGEGGSIAIVINGRQSGAGGIVGGADLIPLIRINGSVPPPTSGFDLRSTANGCLIVGMSCRFDMETPGPPIQDVIDQIVTPPGNEENEDGTAVVQALNIPVIELVDIAGLGFAPLIDEPVTGAGNDDLWIGNDEKAPDGGGK